MQDEGSKVGEEARLPEEVLVTAYKQVILQPYPSHTVV